MNKHIICRLNPRSGQGLVEYALIIGLIAIAAIAALSTLSSTISVYYFGNTGAITNALK